MHPMMPILHIMISQLSVLALKLLIAVAIRFENLANKENIISESMEFAAIDARPECCRGSDTFRKIEGYSNHHFRDTGIPWCGWRSVWSP